ncbi:hypothetical protein BGZ96_001255 [Linnemannia gamsii]|uniref:F-box domain-containing protein n=1 Tax=Linnemannia gamsii TaxID=64522 RepID=A0ABQ7K9U5_9FUNG|nr:hypothetical protein BGZ96_001255 [Linnemannia gamsii]
MNVLGMSDRHFHFKSGQTLSASPSQSSSLSSSTSSSSLSSKLKGKDSFSAASGLINSLKKKSSASTLLSPALSSTGPSTTFTSSLSRPKRCNSTRPLCSASCFSPLDLPFDIFVCLLAFLTPAELWKLSMASREMHRQVTGFMSKIQRFKYSAVRILYQENSGIMYISPSGVAGGSPSPVQTILARIKGASNPRSRQSYWEAQGELLVTAIMEGTPYEPQPGSRTSKETSTKSSPFLETTGAHPPQIQANNADTTVTITPLLDDDATTTTPSSIMTTTSTVTTTTTSIMPTSPSMSTLVSSYASASSSQLSLASTTNKTTEDDTIQVLGPLPMDRFQAMVDLLFDPNIVYLNHRRAIINCARYVSASIADYFKEALSTKDPLDPVFHATFLKQYTVRTGPYLAVFLYDSGAEDSNTEDEDGVQRLPTQPRTSQRSVGSTLVATPSRLQKYFQVMLWHRCMSDLIGLYNRIQRLHVDATHSTSTSTSKESTSPELLESMPESNRAVCCQDRPTSIPSPTVSPVMQESYPFCCNAHSLVFTTHYPASVSIPYPIRQKFRRMAQKLQTKNLWAAVLQGHGTNAAQWEESPVGRHLQYTGSTEKLQFCNGIARPISPATMAAVAASGSTTPPSSSIHKQRREMDDEELVQRRHRIEERIRQDTLMKQELLSLCLMACGLFMVDGRSRHIPPTLMSLLRRYGPWDKGVWREGEWRRSAIDLSSGVLSVEGGARGAYKKKKNLSPSSSLNFSSPRGATAADGAQTEVKDVKKNERGPWQNLCIAAIQFLAHENLAWGGATGNEELSRLRVTINSSQWIYHE